MHNYDKFRLFTPVHYSDGNSDGKFLPTTPEPGQRRSLAVQPGESDALLYDTLLSIQWSGEHQSRRQERRDMAFRGPGWYHCKV